MNETTGIRRIAFLFFLAFGALSLSGLGVEPDYRKIHPLAVPTGEPAVVAAQQRAMGPSARPGGTLSAFLHLSQDDASFLRKIRDLGGEATKVHPRLFTARIPADAPRYLSLWPQVAYIEAGNRAKPLLDFSRPAVSADVVQDGTGLPPPFNGGLTGTGVYVGVVDTGLSGDHLDFHTGGQGSPLRVAHTYSSPGLPGLGLSPDPLFDEDGHGTHVTGIAAGNGFSSAETYTGMAPGGTPPGGGILFGKTSFFTNDIVDAVNDLLTFAGSTPVSINLSLGTVYGPHDGTSGFDNAIGDLAAGAAGSKRIIAVAAGNEAGAKEHFQEAVLPSFGASIASLSVLAGGATVEFWADGADRYTVTAAMGAETVSVPSGASASSSSGRIFVSNRVSLPPNGATFISISFSPSGGAAATVRLDRTRNGGSGKVDGYVNFDPGNNEGGQFTNDTPAGSIIEPATAFNAIAVGSFQTKTDSGTQIPTQPISSFSSLGPTRDGRLRPDLTAPGEYIDSARSLESARTPLPANDNYARLRGTSMATPHVTGIAALVWQSDNTLTGAQMRERLKKTATPVPPSPNTTWGYGKLNALSAVTKSVAAITSPVTAVPGSAVSLTSENSSGAFGQPISFAWVLVSRPSDSAASLSSPAAPSTGFTPDVVGDYTVSLTVSQNVPAGTAPGSATATVHVNNLPIAAISGPSSDNVGNQVTFSGTGSSDPDGKPLTFRWILVSRPSGSSASLTAANADNVPFLPDVAGSYEIGLRVDDGLDNSALVAHAFTAPAPVQPASGGSGGGCGIATGKNEPDGFSPLVTFLIISSPAGALAARRYVRCRRFLRTDAGRKPSRHF